MGVTYCEAELFVNLYLSGVRFGRVLTLGRQWLLCEADEVRRLLSRVPDIKGDYEAFLTNYRYPEHVDQLFMLLGAKSVESLDFSSYEGATIVHDLNEPLPVEHRSSFDFVYDGGTSEHVFNAPRAILSAMELVKPGGTLVLSNPANNLCGHGFWQMSPELMFRLLNPENGFNLRDILLYEYFWYEDRAHIGLIRRPPDPDALRRRVMIQTGHPLNMISVATKVKDVPPEQIRPLQSDYVAIWSEGDRLDSSGKGGKVSQISRVIEWIEPISPHFASLLRLMCNPIRDGNYSKIT